MVQFSLADQDTERKMLPLSKTDGLNAYELQRIFADWGEVKEESKIHQISKNSIPPSSRNCISIIFDCFWDGTGARYEAKQLSIQLNQSSYTGELFLPELISESNRYFLDNEARIEMHPKITQEECMFLKRAFQGKKNVTLNESSIPLELILPHVTYIYSPEDTIFIAQLGVGYSGESYHLRIKRDISKKSGSFGSKYEYSGEEFELIHRTGLPMP